MGTLFGPSFIEIFQEVPYLVPQKAGMGAAVLPHNDVLYCTEYRVHSLSAWDGWMDIHPLETCCRNLSAPGLVVYSIGFG